METGRRRKFGRNTDNGQDIEIVQRRPTKQEPKRVWVKVIKPLERPLNKKSFDYRSVMGQFGWHTVCELHIPYIFRDHDTKMVALRIINQKVLPRFFNIFKQNLFDLFFLHSYTMSEAEKRLYNEINFIHCDYTYGLNSFHKDEQLVRFNDLMQFHNFLVFIYNRLILKKEIRHSNFGYITFNDSENIVPFFKINNVHYMPIVYFEGDEGCLAKNSKRCDAFVESVLRFLIKLQNVQVIVRAMRLISLDIIKKYFDPSTRYQESWVNKEKDVFTYKVRGNMSSMLKVRNADPPADKMIQFAQPPMKFTILQGYEKIAIICPPKNR